jgi:uncharacterized protein
MTEDQGEVVAFLSRPITYGAEVSRVDRLDTHVSQVFLAGDHAYKLKRAVRLPYVDFSTVAHRREACAAELALNRRTAPKLYLETRRIARNMAGEIAFSGDGEEVDWVVVMRRFDQHLLFDALAVAGRLDPALIDELADRIGEFHEAAEPNRERGGAAALARTGEANCDCLAAAPQAGFAPAAIAGIRDKWRAAVTAQAALLDRRRDAGKVRHAHGDLHLRNICLYEGRPTLFDCLEFSEEFATVDVLYDLAFLLMDLEHRGLGHFANRVLNRYLDRSGEDDGLAALPLFLSLRAGIRAHVTATALDPATPDPQKAAEARAYLDLADRALRPRPPRLIAIGGLSGSGKSTLAASLAPFFGPPPGARLLRSDTIRKRLYGVAPETRLPNEAYRAEVTRRVYRTLCDNAATALTAGYSAIIDAAALRPAERDAFAELARAADVPFTGLWLDAPAGIMEERIRARSRDASDATAEVLARQLRLDPGPLDWSRLDAGAGAEACLAAARNLLGL